MNERHRNNQATKNKIEAEEDALGVKLQNMLEKMTARESHVSVRCPVQQIEKYAINYTKAKRIPWKRTRAAAHRTIKENNENSRCIGRNASGSAGY